MHISNEICIYFTFQAPGHLVPQSSRPVCWFWKDSLFVISDWKTEHHSRLGLWHRSSLYSRQETHLLPWQCWFPVGRPQVWRGCLRWHAQTQKMWRTDEASLSHAPCWQEQDHTVKFEQFQLKKWIQSLRNVRAATWVFLHLQALLYSRGWFFLNRFLFLLYEGCIKVVQKPFVYLFNYLIHLFF